jgi:hypothetical protein
LVVSYVKAVYLRIQSRKLGGLNRELCLVYIKQIQRRPKDCRNADRWDFEERVVWRLSPLAQRRGRRANNAGWHFPWSESLGREVAVRICVSGQSADFNNGYGDRRSKVHWSGIIADEEPAICEQRSGFSKAKLTHCAGYASRLCACENGISPSLVVAPVSKQNDSGVKFLSEISGHLREPLLWPAFLRDAGPYS